MITFGPIPSRRLGKSLGINNIISPKICTYNCIYCQVGKTGRMISQRESFFEPELILEKVNSHLKTLDKENYPDYMTFVSNGEPTLDKNLGKAIKLLKRIQIPIAVISNGSLLHDESVQEDLDLADWVSLKMDAGNEDIWHRLNRPAEGLNYDIILKNLKIFSERYKGRMFTETMLVKGVNDTTENYQSLARLISSINPEKAYLSIPTRPPAVVSVKAPEEEQLNIARQIFSGMNIRAELLTGFEGPNAGFTGNIYEDILNIAAVHPVREDMMNSLLVKNGADYAVVDSLIRQHLIKSVIYDGRRFYRREYHLES